MSDRLREYLSIGVMLALVGFFYMQTPSEVKHGGSIFPNALMGALAFLTLLKVAVDLLFPKSRAAKQDVDQATKDNRKRFWFILASIIVYVLLVEYIGFYVSSFVFFFGLTVAVQYEPRTPRGLAIRLASVTGFMLFLWILFTKVLLAQLPKGMFF
ncbi:MAG: tripartite tricarboxylate transporter TctB family protein [Deltaproteobacteria bacterium]|jgi:putative tricarboxylic transport membrane protein|nr:tripartite tricarboxylate transporter TctB family protein [Deltaproteobacteria bacterium]